MKDKIAKYVKIAPLVVGSALIVQMNANADELTIINYGGANAEAQQKAFIRTYIEQTGIELNILEYSGEQAKVRAMVDTGRITWDVVEVESADIARGCDEGLYEEIDWSAIENRDKLIPDAIKDCGVGIFVWSTVFAYNGDLVKEAPQNWADFWDVEKIPGKRGMRKDPRNNLEFALIADGVDINDVYEVLSTREGQDRAFKKLDELKDHIQWWDAGAQAPQFLVAGDVVMSTAFNGRLDTAIREGKNISIVWAGSIYALDYWVMPRGISEEKKKLAQEFMAFTVSKLSQIEYAKNISYGPVNMDAIQEIDPKIKENLPTSDENIKDATLQDVNFWANHGEELSQRFAVWAAR